MNPSVDVIVVGGGLAGLGCAIQLAREGLSVRIIERASRPGGRGLSPAVGTVPMNLGAHALYLGGPGERWLASLGIAWKGFQPNARDAWLSDDDGVFPSPTSLFSLVTAKQFTLGERLGIMRIFATLDRLSSSNVAGLSASQWLDRVAPGPRARRFLDTMVRVSTYSNAHALLPAETAVHQLQGAIGLQSKGVAYIEGGWQSLVDAMEQRAHALGVQVETATHVDNVSEHAEVTLSGAKLLVGRHVIVALPMNNAQNVYPALAISPPRIPARAACVDLVLGAPPTRRLVLGLEAPHYFSVHSAASDPTPIRAHALRYLAPDETGSAWEATLDAWLERVVPDAVAHIVQRRFLPEMTVSSALPAPKPLAPHGERLSFVGDWVSSKYMLFDAVADSACSAVTRILASKKARAAA